MKKAFYLVLILVMAAIFVIPAQLLAQAADTLVIAPSPAGNLNNVISGDTLAGGVRAHPNRVYMLNRGMVYQVTAEMRVNGSITIAATAGTNRPPVLAPAIRADNSSIDNFFAFIGKKSKVSLSNVYFIGVRADGNQLGWGYGMWVQGDSIQLTLKGVTFDAFTATAIQLASQWCKVNVQDCYFRNLMHSSSWFGGQAFMSDNVLHQDTCKFINNTFFSCASYLWSIRGYCPYALFEHNTLVYGIVNPFLQRAQNLHMRNNLFYGMHSMGGAPDHVYNSWLQNYPDTASSGIIEMRVLDTVSNWCKLWGGGVIHGPDSYISATNGVTAAMVDPSKRVTDIQNNAYFWPQKYLNAIKAYNDTVQTKDSIWVPNHTVDGLFTSVTRKLFLPKWITDYSQWTFNTYFPSVGAKVDVTNNLNVDPGFGAAVAGHIDTVDAYVIKIVTDKLDRPWLYNPNNALYPPVWPVPENLAYTNTTMQHGGTDGFAIGDLNWYPSQKSQWILTGVETNNSSSAPDKFTLLQNYPNPFNPSTVISYQITKSGLTTLKVYNVIGQEVAVLVDGMVAAGSYDIKFDASRLSSGIYFYTLHSGNFLQTKKMILMK